MKADELIKYYPQLYHMAEAGTWESISRHGLLSTTALLDLFEINGVARQKLESERRPDSVAIEHVKHGKAVIRDQKPMTESALLKCLQKPLVPHDWYRSLNGNVFFWLDAGRLDRLLWARAYRNKRQCVLTLDSAALIAGYSKAITLSPMNSGSTIYRPLPRGRETFQPISTFPFDQRRASRSLENIVVELLVKYSVPNIRDFVLKVEERKGAKVIATIFERS